MEGFRQGAVPSLYYFKWTEPDTARMNNVTAGTCASTIKRFANSTHCLTLRRDYQQAWAAAWAHLQPFVKNGTYIGVFLSAPSVLPLPLPLPGPPRRGPTQKSAAATSSRGSGVGRGDENMWGGASLANLTTVTVRTPSPFSHQAVGCRRRLRGG